MSRQLTSTRWTDRLRWTLGAIACAYFLLLFAPWQFLTPGAGLDASWMEVISYGARQRWQWGRDVVFTYGPLGFLLPNLYDGGAIGRALAINTFLALALAQGLVALLPRKPLWWSIVLFVLAAFPAAMMGHWAFTVLGLVAALLYFQQPGDVWHWRALVLTAASGVYAMVYVSSGVLGLGIFLLLDLSRLMHRRWPLFVPVFVATAVFSYLAAGQDASHLPQFLRGTLELISGYAGAMSIVGNRWELALFPSLSALVLVGILWSEQARLRRGDHRWDALLLIAAVGVHWFVAFKNGFVRHDFHSVAAWQALAITAATYAAMRWLDPGARRVRWSLIGLSIVACVISIFAWEQNDVHIATVGRHANQVLIRQPIMALEDGINAVIHSAEWRRALLERRMQALSQIRAAAALPSVDGTVDVIHNVQSAVLAGGLQYRPRPVFQDYAAYTPWLIELNRAHYRSAQAAEYVFFRPDTIDNRYPLMDQSTTLNELLTRYDPLVLEGDVLVLKRRAAPVPAVMANTREGTATLGQWISLDAVNGLVMLSMTPSPSVLGRLIAFLFRPPILALTVRLANGDELQFRLIEGIARSGFLLSPIVESSLAFAAAATDSLEGLEDLRVVAFRIDTLAASHRGLYGEAFKYTSALLRLDADVAGARGGSLKTSFQSLKLVRTMAKLASVKAPLVEARGAKLFFHPPAQVGLPVHSARMVRVKFAIEPAAWSEGRATDGVCFHISAVNQDGVRSKLLDRCLDPVSRAEDRPEQTAEISPGLTAPGTLVFETDCRANCNWDWSYWKDIDIEP